jgi:hypothetical protein
MVIFIPSKVWYQYHIVKSGPASAPKRELPGLEVKSIVETDWQGHADPPLLKILERRGEELARSAGLLR